MKTEQAELSTVVSDDKTEEKEEKQNIKSGREQILTISNANLLRFYSPKFSPKRDGGVLGGGHEFYGRTQLATR